jgi:hypothetical protein
MSKAPRSIAPVLMVAAILAGALFWLAASDRNDRSTAEALLDAGVGAAIGIGIALLFIVVAVVVSRLEGGLEPGA